MFFKNNRLENWLKERFAFLEQEMENLRDEFKQFETRWEEEYKVRQEIEELSKRQEGIWDALSEKMGLLAETVKDSEKQIRRQSESFEDLLDELQERQKGKERLERLAEEGEQREKALLSLVNCCRNQMELFEQQFRGDSVFSEDQRTAWREQIQMMGYETEKAMKQCGMEEVGTEGAPVDYDTCQILEVIETKDQHLAGTIAKVYHRGRIYHGRVLVKAQVAAYKKEKGTWE